jgi:cytochrome oxidase Cu insertion factor (SCO1/SenC/PrrC family)
MILIALAILACCLPELSPALAAQGGPWGEGYFPNLPVVSQDGRTLKFYDEVIKGRIVVISFIYTRCTDICPLTTARLALVAERLGDAVGRDIFFVSMTVDPVNDTPQRMLAHANAFHAGAGWLFLTGRPEHIREINGKLGERMRALNEHRNEIVLGNDATGEWARNSVMGDLDRLVMDVRAMDPRWRETVRTPSPDPSSNTGYRMSERPGEALFKRLCAACHAVKVGAHVGPDLYGVVARRPRRWLTELIMSPKQMHARRDPAALALAAEYPGVRMPDLGLTENDAADLIAYLDQRTRWLDAEGRKAAVAARPHQAGHHHGQHRH